MLPLVKPLEVFPLCTTALVESSGVVLRLVGSQTRGGSSSSKVPGQCSVDEREWEGRRGKRGSSMGGEDDLLLFGPVSIRPLELECAGEATLPDGISLCMCSACTMSSSSSIKACHSSVSLAMSWSDGGFQDVSTSGTAGASLLASVELDTIIEVVVDLHR